MSTHEPGDPQPDSAARRVFDGVADLLVARGRVEINGFGTFELVRRKPRLARNPRTGDRIEVPARTVVRFLPARSLKSRAAGITQLPLD